MPNNKLGEEIMEKIVYRFDGSGETYRSSDAFPIGGTSHTKVNARRMSAALNSETIQMPAGLSREEMRAYILAHAAK